MNLFCPSVLQSSNLGLQSQPASAVSLQVPGHLLLPSQTYVTAVPNTAPVQPSYVPASQPVQMHTYSSLPSTAQQQATILQPVQPTPAQSTSPVPQMASIQSCSLIGQCGQSVVQANAAVPQSFTPGVQQLASMHILPPLQQSEPGQMLPSMQQATQNVLADQQSAGSTAQHLTNVQNLPASQCSVQPVTAYIAAQHAPSALQLNMQASHRAPSSVQHDSSAATPMSREDPMLTSCKGLSTVDFKESTAFLPAPLQTIHMIAAPVQQVSFKV